MVTTALLISAAAMIANAQDAKLQLDQLDALTNRASETVDVKIDEKTMKNVAFLFKDADDADIRDALKGVKGIYVKVFTFAKEGQYAPTEVESVLTQLRGANWSRLVSVKSKDEDNVEVYLNQTGEQINGVAVISLEPKEILVVNIVGPIDLSKLGRLEGTLGVPDLGIEKETPKKKKDQ